MKSFRPWLILLTALILVSCLASCSQSSQTQATPTSTSSGGTPTATPATAVWETLSFTVVDTEWQGNMLRIRLRAENIGNQTITFDQVFYAYEDIGNATRMCQPTLQNIWATYQAGDVRSESIYFVLPPSSSDIWLAVGAAKIIKIHHESVTQALPATQTYMGFVFTLKSVQWSGGTVALSLSIQNTNNSQVYIEDLGNSSSAAPSNALCLISTSSMGYGIPPTSGTSDWYSGAYEAGDIRSGTIYFDVPSCAVDLYLQLGNAGEQLFEIYR
ncbi:MAG TPA: hypothetical protein VEG28_01070 [Dehalococcoidia bacterium]|nr:hypothetical protein [Dehalococcoidia bacterium]